MSQDSRLPRSAADEVDPLWLPMAGPPGHGPTLIRHIGPVQASPLVGLFDTYKRHVELGDADLATLRRALPGVLPALPAIAEQFYARVQIQPETRRIVKSPEQVERLKTTLTRWAEELFRGPYDRAYLEKRVSIGAMHVQIGLDPSYVFSSMTGLRSDLEDVVQSAFGGDPEFLAAVRKALAKVLDLDLALISGSYHEVEKYRDMVEFAPEMIHQLDRDGRFLSVNRTEEERLGYPAQELLGRRLEDFVVEDDRPIFRRHLERVFSEGESRCELRLLTARGEVLDVEVLASGIANPNTGEFMRTRAYVRDVSQRKRMEEALRRERDTAQGYLDVSGAILCVLDRSRRFALINKKGCEIFGYSEAEMLGQPVESVFSSKSSEPLLAAVDRVLAGHGAPFEPYETHVLTKGGEERVIEWHHAAPQGRNGSVDGVLISGVDISERKRMETTLVEQASLARLGELVAIVAHEIKNPLAGIGGALQVIQGQLPQGGTGREMAEEILRRLEALNDTVNDLLLFARPRLPSLSPVPVLTLVQDTVGLLIQDPAFAEIQVDIEGVDIIIACDAELLKPALYNILLNAAQAMKGKGRIRVVAGLQGGFSILAIEDQGPGVPIEMRERIFEPFFSTKHRGTGLGLPIAKRIIESHNGRIQLESPPGRGARMVISLPVFVSRTMG